jgi:hypothetical protein
MERTNVGLGKIVTLEEWCSINKVKKSLGYEMSRGKAIAGMFKILGTESDSFLHNCT